MYSKNVPLIRKHKVTIDFEKIKYDFIKLHETMEYGDFEDQIIVAINNPYQLKIRTEKQIAEIFGLSGSRVKHFLEKGEMKLKAELPQFISISISVCQLHMDHGPVQKAFQAFFTCGQSFSCTACLI